MTPCSSSKIQFMRFYMHWHSSDINADYDLGTELLQQPLLSAQIIPELPDEEPACKLLKTMPGTNFPKQQQQQSLQPQIKRSIQQQPQQQQQQNRVVFDEMQSMESNLSNKRIEIIQMNGTMDTYPKRKIQILRKVSALPAAVEQNASIKINTALINDTLANGQLVLNKVNGNISGELCNHVEICAVRLILYFKWIL